MASLEETYMRCLTVIKLLHLDDSLSISIRENDIVVKNYKFSVKPTKISLPYGITCLADGCFSGTNVELVRLSGSITSVGYGCFANCPHLKTICIHESQKQFSEQLLYGNHAKLDIIS